MNRSLPAVVAAWLLLASPAAACGNMGSTQWGLALLGMMLVPLVLLIGGLLLFFKLLSWLFFGSEQRHSGALSSLRFQCRECRPGQVKRYRTERGWECQHALAGRGAATIRAETAVAVERVRAAEGARCPVCNSGVEGRTLACGRCAVPHHEDCFAYNGGCAIFGCVA